LADDVAAATDWYTQLLGVEPYFARSAGGMPAYAEYRIGDYQHELGILNRRFAAPGQPREGAGAPVYWRGDDVHARLARLPGPRARPPANSRSSEGPDSSPHRSSIRSATFSA